MARYTCFLFSLIFNLSENNYERSRLSANGKDLALYVSNCMKNWCVIHECHQWWDEVLTVVECQSGSGRPPWNPSSSQSICLKSIQSIPHVAWCLVVILHPPTTWRQVLKGEDTFFYFRKVEQSCVLNVIQFCFSH